MINLSKRLQAIANFVPFHTKLADIATDHALLPTYLIQSKRIDYAVAGEINEGPFQAATKQVQNAQLHQWIDVRKGDGLSVLKDGEVETVVIAGVGGALIRDILELGQQKLKGIQLLILQPNVGEKLVRRWLIDHHWHLLNEQIVEEDGKMYEIIVAEQNENADQLNRELLDKTIEWMGEKQFDIHMKQLVGPHLLQHPNEALYEKWKLEAEKLEIIISNMSSSKHQDALDKALSYKERLGNIKEMLACMPREKL